MLPGYLDTMDNVRTVASAMEEAGCRKDCSYRKYAKWLQKRIDGEVFKLVRGKYLRCWRSHGCQATASTRLCGLSKRLRQANRYVQHTLPFSALHSSHNFVMTAPSNVDQSVLAHMVNLRLRLDLKYDRSTSLGMVCVPDINVYIFLLVGLQMTHLPISCCLTSQLNTLTGPKRLDEDVLPVAHFRYLAI